MTKQGDAQKKANERIWDDAFNNFTVNIGRPAWKLDELSNIKKLFFTVTRAGQLK